MRSAYRFFSFAVFLLLLFRSSSFFAAHAFACELDRPIIFADYGWESNDLHVSIVSFVLERGYQCKTDRIIGSTIMLLNGLSRGDVDISMEVWPNSISAVWKKGVKRGSIVALGPSFTGAMQGYFVPKYLIEGEDAPARGLKSIFDLPKFKSLFQDPEEPDKGRFYGCPHGWSCDIINAKKFKVYGISDHFVNYRPGTGSALIASIESHLKRGEPVVFYAWAPSALMGEWGDQIIRLEEPPYDGEIWEKLLSLENPDKATAYPLGVILKGVGREFYDAAPSLVDFLRRYQMRSSTIDKILASMKRERTTAQEETIRFLKTQSEVWEAWVPEDVATRIKAVL